MSIVMIVIAFLDLAAMTALISPEPMQKMTTDLPGCTPGVFKMAQALVWIPHLSEQNRSRFVSILGSFRASVSKYLNAIFCQPNFLGQYKEWLRRKLKMDSVGTSMCIKTWFKFEAASRLI